MSNKTCMYYYTVRHDITNQQKGRSYTSSLGRVHFVAVDQLDKLLLFTCGHQHLPV